MTISASMTAYSTAVGPSSETRKRCTFLARLFHVVYSKFLFWLRDRSRYLLACPLLFGGVRPKSNSVYLEPYARSARCQIVNANLYFWMLRRRRFAAEGIIGETRHRCRVAYSQRFWSRVAAKPHIGRQGDYGQQLADSAALTLAASRLRYIP